ncbi:DUF1127 domain-containing protein [Actibacterium sp. 188UL27-1]|uniref:DUF1127 domain-containing protein n=1 Tax=Actibacterium sp. 188UL27-1 TaxID=2786961 RepID=UPI00195D937C|nr:DUF1127 domain-containing protein [Actibacterium sp. 188UL27-1]MBM7066674.1 DUF1127 domain-containing protein [Actibacterium sp. 188UL27-1]
MAHLQIIRPRRHRGFSLISIFRTIYGAYQTQRERHRLKDLDPHMLNDIGLTSEDVRSELNRPIWDVPAHWMR